jgi:hypothetical protein
VWNEKKRKKKRQTHVPCCVLQWPWLSRDVWLEAPANGCMPHLLANSCSRPVGDAARRWPIGCQQLPVKSTSRRSLLPFPGRQASNVRSLLVFHLRPSSSLYRASLPTAADHRRSLFFFPVGAPPSSRQQTTHARQERPSSPSLIQHAGHFSGSELVPLAWAPCLLPARTLPQRRPPLP